MTTNTAERTREQRLRRMADRQGYALRKPRRRDPRALDYGESWLMRCWVQDESGRIEEVANPEDTDDAWLGPFRSLDELEEWLTADPETRPDIEARKQSGDSWLDHWKRRRQSRASVVIHKGSGSRRETVQSFGPFRSVEDADAWCERKGLGQVPSAGEWATVFPMSAPESGRER